MRIDGLSKRHVCYERRIPERLEIHERTLVAFEFNDDEPPTLIESENIDLTVTLVPVAVPVGEYEEPRLKHVRVVAQPMLEVATLLLALAR